MLIKEKGIIRFESQFQLNRTGTFSTNLAIASGDFLLLNQNK